jgi:hypothetical protein
MPASIREEEEEELSEDLREVLVAVPEVMDESSYLMLMMLMQVRINPNAIIHYFLLIQLRHLPVIHQHGQ